MKARVLTVQRWGCIEGQYNAGYVLSQLSQFGYIELVRELVELKRHVRSTGRTAQQIAATYMLNEKKRGA